MEILIVVNCFCIFDLKPMVLEIQCNKCTNSESHDQHAESGEVTIIIVIKSIDHRSTSECITTLSQNTLIPDQTIMLRSMSLHVANVPV